MRLDHEGGGRPLVEGGTSQQDAGGVVVRDRGHVGLLSRRRDQDAYLLIVRDVSDGNVVGVSMNPHGVRRGGGNVLVHWFFTPFR